MDNELYNDPEFQALIRRYLDYLLKEVAKVKISIQNSNFQEIRKFSHNLKGTGGGYGFDNFTDFGGKINEAAHAENIQSVESFVSEFELDLATAVQQFNPD